jgi:hypothetical protein
MLGSSNSMASFHKQFQPNDISDCELHLNYADGIILDGEMVDSWADQSGNGLFAVSPADAKRPVYNGTYLTFDGSNDYLNIQSSIIQGVGATQITLDVENGGWTFIGIYTSTDWNGTAQAISGDPDNSQNFIRHNTDNTITVKASNVTKIFTLDSTLRDEDYYLIEVSRHSDGETLIYINGIVQTDTEDSAENFVVEEIGAKGGAANPLGGNIKHIILYNHIITNPERALLVEWAQQYIS